VKLVEECVAELYAMQTRVTTEGHKCFWEPTEVERRERRVPLSLSATESPWGW
jgi:hypothetical protein